MTPNHAIERALKKPLHALSPPLMSNVRQHKQQ